MPTDVSDHASNSNEQIDHAARTIGRSDIRRKVFTAIYHGKKRIKTVGEVADQAKLDRKQVLTEGRRLANAKVVRQVKHKGDTAYEKIDALHHHKTKILRLAGNHAGLESFPTKRNPTSKAQRLVVQLDTKRAKSSIITIDDIESFSKARSVSLVEPLPEHVSETEFKHGIQKIVGEQGEFNDWGGEKNDLFTTRLLYKGHRRAAAFAFKGPGTKGKLTPGKMGKNGDQIQRLFEADAEVFIVQYWRDIDQSVLSQMGQLAQAKSVMAGREVWYGIIDGVDSNRIYIAYSSKFSKKTLKHVKLKTIPKRSKL